jgi:hypothetical protein
MKQIATLAAFGFFALSLGTAWAAADAATDGRTKQQAKMKSCNAEAKTENKKGEERRKFMSECLKK